MSAPIDDAPSVTPAPPPNPTTVQGIHPRMNRCGTVSTPQPAEHRVPGFVFHPIDCPPSAEQSISTYQQSETQQPAQSGAPLTSPVVQQGEDTHFSAASIKPPAGDTAGEVAPKLPGTHVAPAAPLWTRFNADRSGSLDGKAPTFEPVIGTAPNVVTGANAPPMGPTMAPWALNRGHNPSGGAPPGDGTQRTAGQNRGESPPMGPTSAPWANSGAEGKVGSLPDSTGKMSLPNAGIGKLSGQQTPPTIPARMSWPDVVPVSATATFEPARKRIVSEQLLYRFLEGDSVQRFVGFILALNEAVKGKKLSSPCPVSPATLGILQLLETLSRWVDEIPPTSQPLRYGNPAYRTWNARVVAEAEQLLISFLPADRAAAAPELSTYLADSFGNPTRIDYGTGHEATFVALLYCLARLGVVAEDDAQALVTHVFSAYIDLMRKVQTTYWLEPAGSHGVWGLDDYQFLPFLWGASQLANHPVIKPLSIHNEQVLTTCSPDYLYLSGVQFVKQVKKGPLGETSPMLNDISGVATWQKVNSGMVKMYRAELLSKFPIMQHFLFGSLLPFDGL